MLDGISNENNEAVDTGNDSGDYGDSVFVEDFIVDPTKVVDGKYQEDLPKTKKQPEKQERNNNIKNEFKTETPNDDLPEINIENMHEHIDFLTKDFSDKKGLPEEFSPKPKPVENAPGQKPIEKPSEELSHSQQYLSNINKFKNIFEQFITHHSGNWDMAKNDIERYFEVEAREYERDIKHENRLKEIEERENAYSRNVKIAETKKDLNKTVYEVANSKGYKNSKVMMDQINENCSEIIFNAFENKYPDWKYENSDVYKKNWEMFQIEYGSNKKNMEQLEYVSRCVGLAKNFNKIVNMKVESELRKRKDLDRGKNTYTSTNNSIR